ncbi:ribbon-helix-helix protein, CopG family [Halomonas cerina]|uniref:Metal-responsive CopG/Arc/MetJ family transcriptional regulator n=1 Tax=Halomonas cerina TaxID=447424 RepID=A0A839VAM7_9GAMM|nr:ribbon-helix-helix protein, CopG family [Halomonas cerina]MBB3189566.1 metal-responsive CopG/Arc/MetJ family transcriptional regulator [Halomonas cerina]
MSTLSIRFPEDLERKLAEEARLAHKGRSELVREAVQEYVLRRERERFIQDMVQEMREWQDDALGREVSGELSDEMPDDDLDALIRTEHDAGVDPNARWWK